MVKLSGVAWLHGCDSQSLVKPQSGVSQGCRPLLTDRLKGPGGSSQNTNIASELLSPVGQSPDPRDKRKVMVVINM